MSNYILYLLMLCCGIVMAVQPSINARLARIVGVLESSCISFAVGTVALLMMVLLVGRGSLRGVAGASWWELTGGLLGAFFVTMTILVVPRIGTAAAMAAIIAGQLATGLLMDHFGLFGGRHIPLDTSRMLGVALLMAGGWLVFRRAAG
ncbi:MAG TPA: DMT family transporter [Dongiaceae bacterium]|nr:DMT family transporter [Dongiaceae bacterium]